MRIDTDLRFLYVEPVTDIESVLSFVGEHLPGVMVEEYSPGRPLMWVEGLPSTMSCLVTSFNYAGSTLVVRPSRVFVDDDLSALTKDQVKVATVLPGRWDRESLERSQVLETNDVREALAFLTERGVDAYIHTSNSGHESLCYFGGNGRLWGADDERGIMVMLDGSHADPVSVRTLAFLTGGRA